jgi:hypothetical protein
MADFETVTIVMVDFELSLKISTEAAVFSTLPLPLPLPLSLSHPLPPLFQIWQRTGRPSAAAVLWCTGKARLGHWAQMLAGGRCPLPRATRNLSLTFAPDVEACHPAAGAGGSPRCERVWTLCPHPCAAQRRERSQRTSAQHGAGGAAWPPTRATAPPCPHPMRAGAGA